jgi:hypothetical protein
MQIEQPQFTPVAAAPVGPVTIGDFYDTIVAGFKAVNPAINSNAHSVSYGEVVPIKTVADAIAAINRIKDEGEGTTKSPDQAKGGTLAHYYVFKQIFEGKTLIETNGRWDYAGSDIQFPAVFKFAKSLGVPDPSLAFDQALSSLLMNLQVSWTTAAQSCRRSQNEDARRFKWPN